MIRSELDVLLDKVDDPALRADIQSQIARLNQRRSFGLVFEQHIPERVRLPQHPIRVGSQVVNRDDDDSPTFEVVAIEDRLATLVLTRESDGAYVPRGEDVQAVLTVHESRLPQCVEPADEPRPDSATSPPDFRSWRESRIPTR